MEERVKKKEERSSAKNAAEEGGWRRCVTGHRGVLCVRKP